MDAHRSRSLGMAALIFILISLTAAVFHGAAPVRAEDATTPTPIEINGDTATVRSSCIPMRTIISLWVMLP